MIVPHALLHIIILKEQAVQERRGEHPAEWRQPDLGNDIKATDSFRVFCAQFARPESPHLVIQQVSEQNILIALCCCLEHSRGFWGWAFSVHIRKKMCLKDSFNRRTPPWVRVGHLWDILHFFFFWILQNEPWCDWENCRAKFTLQSLLLGDALALLFGCQRSFKIHKFGYCEVSKISSSS